MNEFARTFVRFHNEFNSVSRAFRLRSYLTSTMSTAAPSSDAASEDAWARAAAKRWQAEVEKDLFGRVIPFWLEHSIDGANGGFFNCLSETGAVWDKTKHVWLQGRQCWMLARLAATHSDADIMALAARHAGALSPSAQAKAREPAAVARSWPAPLTRASLVAAAARGVTFLEAHAESPSGQIYFALAADGAPAAEQRKPFAALFMVLALSEVARVTGDAAMRARARALFERALGWVGAPGREAAGGLPGGRPQLPGAPHLAPLNVPMIVLNVIMELAEAAGEPLASMYPAEQAWAVAGILAHVIRDPISSAVTAVLEGVTLSGAPDMTTAEGRTVNPGHAIEAGWFLLAWARANAAAPLPASVPGAAALPPADVIERTALDVVDWALAAGWDTRRGADGAELGGILYFLDAAGWPAPQLEAEMKLWWPACEAMVATAMAYRHTREPRFMRAFDKVASWAYAHLVDKANGEWYGYAARDGSITHAFKGGPYKGCFHVPRALFMCSRLLNA